MPDISIASPEFTRAWQFLQDHLLHEIEVAEPEGREALDIINAAIERAQARTAEDERRDTLAYLTKRAEIYLSTTATREPAAIAIAHNGIARGDHIGAAARKEAP